MVDVDAELDRAGLHNPHVREFVRYWAALTEPDRVEVVSTADDARLIEESLAAGEIAPGRRGPLLLAQPPQGHRAVRGAHDRRHRRPGRRRRLQQLAPVE